MSEARVSVAMASCEGAAFLESQLESIAEQTRLPSELILFDDASSDASAAIATNFAARAGFAMRVEVNSARLGATRNFEQAVAACTGDVIFLADQDDVWAPEKIETLCDVLDERPEVGLVFSNGEVVDAELEPLGHSLWQALGFDALEQRAVREGRALDVFLRHVVAAGTTLAFRAAQRDLALPFPDLRSAHDAFLAFVIAAVAEVAIVERPLIRYRVHGDNLIGIRALSLTDQIEKAREQLEQDAFGYAARFFSEARERIAGADAAVPPATLAAIDAKIAHARRRAGMSAHLSGRLGDVTREALSGRYWRYSYGLRSIAQDLWLR